MRLPKLRELKEAVTAVVSPRFTTRFPAQPCEVPDRYRGKPEFDEVACVGCGACVNACPTQALTMTDDLQARPPVRRMRLRYDRCIFCGNCAENCTTQTGIRLSRQWDLAGLDRDKMVEVHTHELQLCQRCGALVGTRKHLSWLYEKLGPLAYANPSLLLVKGAEMGTEALDGSERSREGVQTSDLMRILCPQCKYEVTVRI